MLSHSRRAVVFTKRRISLIIQERKVVTRAQGVDRLTKEQQSISNITESLYVSKTLITQQQRYARDAMECVPVYLFIFPLLSSIFSFK